MNVWGIHNEGHINVGFTPVPGQARLLDCRILSTGPVTFKIYRGAGEALQTAGERSLARGHLFVLVPASASADRVSVELWPTPTTATLGFFGCELSAAG